MSSTTFLSVRQITRVLIERFSVFQDIFNIYNLGATQDFIQKPLETLYTMLLEVSEISRETKLPEDLKAGASDDSNRMRARANASYADFSSDINSGPSGTQSASHLDVRVRKR